MKVDITGVCPMKGHSAGDTTEKYMRNNFLRSLPLPSPPPNFFLLNLPFLIWAPSSEFVSSSIPSWQILTAHAQPFRGARDLAFCLKVPLDSLLVWASSEGSGETARMRRLAWTFAARIDYNNQIRMTRSIFSVHLYHMASWVTLVWSRWGCIIKTMW